MKIKFFYSLFIVLCLCQIGFSTDSLDYKIVEHKPKELCSVVSTNLETWLEGQTLSGENLMVYFDVSPSEFMEFISMNDINMLTMEYFWRSNAGTQVLPVGTSNLTNFNNEFNVQNWAHSIKNADVENGGYWVRMTINGLECGQMIEIPIVIEEMPITENNLPIELPEFECGETYTPDPIDNFTPLPSAEANEVFFINGFPILLETVEGGNGIFTGTGIIPLPFNNSMVKVEFTSVEVNDDRVIHQGSVAGIAGNPDDYPNFTVNNPTLNIGGDICLESPAPGYNNEGVSELTGVTDYGFNSDGINEETGEPYDPNGFNVNGEHLNGTPFNEYGCSRDGLTEDGDPCDPSSGGNPAVETFVNIIETTGVLTTQIPSIVTQLVTEITTNLGSPELDCDEIRSQMDNLVDNVLNYDRASIYGENDEYYDEGMHENFKQRLKPLSVNLDRDQNVTDLENLHIDLYDCDKARFVAAAYESALEELMGDDNSNLASIVESILEKIRNWTEYEYNLYSNDEEKFNNWLIREIGKMMEELSGLDESYGAIEKTEEQSIDEAKHQLKSIFKFDRGNVYNATASINGYEAYDFVNGPLSLEDAAFQFLQGEKYIDGIHRAYYLEELARQQVLLANEEEGTLPVSIINTPLGGNKSYQIYLDNIIFDAESEQTYLDAYCIISDAESNQRLVFSAKEISIGPTGFTGPSQLKLETEVEIRLNNAAMLILYPTDTYVNWDCDGFAGVGINAAVEFCRNFIVPLGENVGAEDRYRLEFNTEFTNWLDFDFTVLAADPFSVHGFEDIEWNLTNLIIDMSSEMTPDFTPLAGYASPFWDGNNMDNLWKGFYMGNLSAKINNDFRTDGEPIVINVTSVLIDGSGFSGEASVTGGELLSIDKGNLGGWAFSIDDFEVRILNNHFAGSSFAGDVKVPIIGDPLEYEAVLFPDSEYSFAISRKEDTDFPVFLADVSISENSWIKAGYVDGELLAVAQLSGELTVNEDLTGDLGKKLNLPRLKFEDLKLSNRSPHFELGEWGILDGENTGGSGNNIPPDFKFNKFPVKLEDVSPYALDDQTIGLRFRLALTFAKGMDEVGINATGDFDIQGKLETDDYQRQSWAFESINVNELSINASFPGVAKIKGGLKWFKDDADYGEGFKAILKTQFDFIDLNVDAAALFGKKDGKDYFFVDAAVGLGGSLTTTGIVRFRGFSGGVSYHMNVDQTQMVIPTEAGPSELPLGGTFSGATYTFDSEIGLGLKANAIISSVSDQIFNGTVGLTFLFNDGEAGNGLHSISVHGSGQLMADIDLGILPEFPDNLVAPPSSVEAKLSLYINLTFNFNVPSFDGNLKVFLNADYLEGAGDNGELAYAQIRFTPGQWFIYVGTPDNRCSIKVDLPFASDLIIATAYLDVGSLVPSMPDLPANVQEIAYKVNKNSTLRNSGAGFVFGASIKLKLEAKAGFIASATVDVEAGFDLMLKKYSDLHCQGSTETVGWDGWYGSGQMWGYATGKLKVFGVNIFEAGIAAVLQARLPNPFWAQATVGVKVKLLLYTAHVSLKLELGNDCILESNDPLDELGMTVIQSMEPFNSGYGIPTDIQPYATLALTLDSTFVAPTADGLSSNLFLATFNNTSLVAEDGTEVFHEVKREGWEIRVIPNEMLRGNTIYTFTVAVDVFKNGSLLTTEEQSVTFTTGPAFDYFPESNIIASYPINGMTNFYKNENPGLKGFIHLDVGQPDLLLNMPNNVEQKMRLTDTEGNETFFPYEYDAFNNQINFDLDPSLMVNEGLYLLEMIRVPVPNSGGANSFAGIARPSDAGGMLAVALGGRNGGPNPPSTNGYVGGDGSQETKSFYKIHFRVSKYNTLGEKVEAIDANSKDTDRNRFLIGMENFDELELTGNGKYEPLLKLEADVQGEWMSGIIDEFGETVGFRGIGIVLLPSNNPLDLDLSWQIFRIRETAENSVKVFGPAPGLITPEVFSGDDTYTGEELQRINFKMEHKVLSMIGFLKSSLSTSGLAIQASYVAGCDESPQVLIVPGCDCPDEGPESLDPESDYWSCPIATLIGEDNYGLRSSLAPAMPIGSEYKCYLSYSLPNATTTTPGKTIKFVKSQACTTCN